ncbi:MAG: leucine-rich repeat domain-containing protein [Corallococcus sp.]|nr:leucine-rich repeat domain-containing protein [Corallococcus sp.]
MLSARCLCALAAAIIEKLTAKFDGEIVYDDDGLDFVKTHCDVVYTDKSGKSEPITDFELSGSLEGGDCTLVITYGELSCNVSVKVFPQIALSNRLIDSGESYAVDGIGSVTNSDIEIPVRYKGKAVTAIWMRAFDSCASLVNIIIPASVKSIAPYAFDNCTNLETVNYLGTISDWCNIEFGSNNSANPLYYAGKLYLQGELVTQLIIPHDVQEIYGYTFTGCTSITSVLISAKVQSVGDYAFYRCDNLKEVFYGADETQWSAISMNAGRNSALTDAERYYYSEQQPTSDGNYWYYVNEQLTKW